MLRLWTKQFGLRWATCFGLLKALSSLSSSLTLTKSVLAATAGKSECWTIIVENSMQLCGCAISLDDMCLSQLSIRWVRNAGVSATQSCVTTDMVAGAYQLEQNPILYQSRVPAIICTDNILML